MLNGKFKIDFRLYNICKSIIQIHKNISFKIMKDGIIDFYIGLQSKCRILFMIQTFTPR